MYKLTCGLSSGSGNWGVASIVNSRTNGTMEQREILLFVTVMVIIVNIIAICKMV